MSILVILLFYGEELSDGWNKCHLFIKSKTWIVYNVFPITSYHCINFCFCCFFLLFLYRARVYFLFVVSEGSLSIGAWSGKSCILLNSAFVSPRMSLFFSFSLLNRSAHDSSSSSSPSPLLSASSFTSGWITIDSSLSDAALF